jgi:hypothetical protein
VHGASGVPAQPERRGLERLGASRGDDDAVARAQQLLGGGVADSGAAPADQGVASVDGSLLFSAGWAADRDGSIVGRMNPGTNIESR